MGRTTVGLTNCLEFSPTKDLYECGESLISSVLWAEACHAASITGTCHYLGVLLWKRENSRSWTVTFFIMGKMISASSWNRSSFVTCSTSAAQRSATILYFRFSLRHSFRRAWTTSVMVGWAGTDFCSSALKWKAGRHYHVNLFSKSTVPREEITPMSRHPAAYQ